MKAEVPRLSAIREAWRRLRHEPWEFGESLYRLPAMRLQVCCALVRPLIIHFAISEDHPLVFIKKVELLAKEKLEQ